MNCITGQCEVDQLHVVVNRAMQEMFAEAGADLAATLATLAGGRIEGGSKPTVAPSPGQAEGSVDETIESILKGK